MFVGITYRSSDDVKCLDAHFIFIDQFTTGHYKTLTNDRKIVPNLNNMTATSNDVENNVVFFFQI